MIDFKNLRHTDSSSVTFFDTSSICDNWCIDIVKHIELLPSVEKLCKDWNVPYEVVAKHILDTELRYEVFTYSTTPKFKHSLKVAENALYKVRYVREKGTLVEKRMYKDVYVVENNFISLVLPKLANMIMCRYYGKYCVYEDVIKYEKCEIKKNESLARIIKRFGDDINVGDLIDLVDGKPVCEKSLAYAMYDNCSVLYYHLGTDEIQGKTFERTLYIPRTAIINNDWSIVEDCYVYSIINNDANNMLGSDENNWYSGVQSKSPYWEKYREKIEAIKKLFN